MSLLYFQDSEVENCDEAHMEQNTSGNQINEDEVRVCLRVYIDTFQFYGILNVFNLIIV